MPWPGDASAHPAASGRPRGLQGTDGLPFCSFSDAACLFQDNTAPQLRVCPRDPILPATMMTTAFSRPSFLVRESAPRSPKLLDRVREAIRLRHGSRSTERTSTKFELVTNVKAAKSIGLAIPQPVIR